MTARDALAPLALLLTLAARPALADDLIRLERPNALRLGGRVQTGGILGGPLWDAAVDLIYSRQLSALFAVEASGGGGSGGSRHGDNLGTGLRLTLGSHGPHAFTVAAGGRVAFLHQYGPVAFGNAEAAWELRTGGGFDLLVGGGLGVTLSTSRSADQHCEDRGWLGCPRSRFHAGEAGLWVRAEAGFAF
jgi:hypothetical protein